MILRPGEKLHLIHCRRFEKDVRRHFAGVVEDYDAGLVRLTGYAFVTDDMSKHEFVRRPERRIKIAALGSGEFVANILPEKVVIDKLRYEFERGRLVVTDGSWKMDVKEFGSG